MDQNCIELIGVSKCYQSSSGERWALQEINLKIKQGEFVGIAGRNGSGKTTLARLFNGLILPTAGKVLVNGMDTADRRCLFQIRSQVGMVFQNPDHQIVSPIVEEDIAFGPENLGFPREKVKELVERALKDLGLEKLRNHAPHLLSGGQKQRVAIAAVLAMQPAYLVLDEPTAMLDQQANIQLIRHLKRLRQEYGMTIVLISHHMEDLTFVDRVIVLDKGRIQLDGSPASVFQEINTLERCGLKQPEIVQMADNLRKKGYQVDPDIVNLEQMVEHICRLLKLKV